MTQPQTYYRDEQNEGDDIGIVIVAVDDDSLRVVENRANGWCAPFWMPVSEFDAEQVGKLSDDKFERVVAEAKA